MECSLLIPVYNYNSERLVFELLHQAEKISDCYELILLNDGSTECLSQFEKYETFQNVKIIHLSKNRGRSFARNHLIEIAKYENCIMIDCDMIVESKQFIYNYLTELEYAQVIVGGHQYKRQKPKQSHFFLHWKYGTEFEVKTILERKGNPYHSFTTACFAFKKSVLRGFSFIDLGQFYGHEDTFFAFDLEHHNILIEHIENPCIHAQLSTNIEFIKKQEEALDSLVLFYHNYPMKDSLRKNIRILSLLSKGQKNWLSHYILNQLYRFRNVFEQNLYSKEPKIFVLQLYKLILLNQKIKIH